jgi:hypothetical protein
VGTVVLTFDDAARKSVRSALTPIGAAPVALNTTLMRLQHDPAVDGGYRFAGEVPASFGAFRRILEIGDGSVFAALRLEAKLAPAAGGGTAGDWLVCTEDPYSSFWVATARFKGPNRKGRERLDAATIDNPAAAACWLESEATDYWETGSALTAALMQGAFGRVHRGAAQAVRKSARYVLGLCPGLPGQASGVDAATRALWDSEALRNLRAETARGTIAIAYQGRQSPLKQSVRDDCVSIMYMAIQQALAGPPDRPESFVGQPVVTLVSRIYRDHLNNLNRQVFADGDGDHLPLDYLELSDWGRRQAQQFYALDRTTAEGVG